MDVEGNKKKNAEVGVNHFSNDKRKERLVNALGFRRVQAVEQCAGSCFDYAISEKGYLSVEAGRMANIESGRGNENALITFVVIRIISLMWPIRLGKRSETVH